MDWERYDEIPLNRYKCGYCGHSVASNQGLQGRDHVGNRIATALCPNCNSPTLITPWKQVPGPLYGAEIEGIDDESVGQLYEEARACMAASAYTAAVLACRKILMHVAVAKGAERNRSFVDYVTYLADSGYVPPDGRPWLDAIREAGNQANHEIVIANRDRASEVLSFVEMLLRLVFELPHRIKIRSRT